MTLTALSNPTGAAPAERLVAVGVGDAEVSGDPEAVLVTHALGSCLGVVIHDRDRPLAGLFHPMLPTARDCTEAFRARPFSCVDTGFPLFLKWLEDSGARRARLRVRVAGGARMFEDGKPEELSIGKRNMVVLRRLLWKAGLLIESECTGGSAAQTVRAWVASGRVLVSSGRESFEL